PMPVPRSGRPKRFIFPRVRRDRGAHSPRSRESAGKLRPNVPYLVGAFVLGGATGTAQPPLPLQEFLPAHPLSPVLQPPSPFHPFWPPQPCLASAEAQPPLPLQVFLPAQPLSPVLQPPLPLQPLWPLQMFFSALSAGLSLALSPAFSSARRADPAARPAATAPSTFVNSRRFMRESSLEASRIPSPRRRLAPAILVYRIPKMQFIISFHRPRLRHSENAGSSIRIVPLRSPLLALRHQKAGRMGL